jgi:diguanylate cyclase (GGDEF)-like protein/PAS domain S-box-containing protein
VHAVFITALGVANIVGWRLNEEVRQQMRRTEGRFRSAFDQAPIGMAIVTREGRFLQVNRRLAEVTGYEAEAMLSLSLDDIDGDGGRWRPVEGGGEEQEHRFRHADGSTGWCLFQHSPADEEDAGSYVCQFVDLTRRKHAESELRHQAYYDPLTALPNRKEFTRSLTIALDNDETLGVAFIDIDDFKVINDSLGHDAGDRLLVAVAERLRRVLRPDDLLARFGGDEFTALLERVDDARHALRVADRLGAALRAPFVIDGQQRYVTASVGVALSHGENDAEDLLRDADAAMYRAKELGKARCELFDQSMGQRSVDRLELEAGLRGALANDELRLRYQPAVELGSGRVVGVEALLRWEHPELGLLEPDSFIPLAEQTGLIVPLGEWVLAEACRQLSEWGLEALTVAVNVSPRQLASPGLVEAVTSALEEADLLPSRLCLEITESAVIADPEVAVAKLHRLKGLGVRLAVDDFGIGYSSLASLRELLPVDALKIDRLFVSGLDTNADDRAIVESVIRLARSLDLDAVAEGVETADQAQLLTSLGCSHAQGFYYARPLVAAELAQLLAAEAFDEVVS